MASQIQVGTEKAEEAVKRLIIQFKKLRDAVIEQGEHGVKSTRQVVAELDKLDAVFKKVVPIAVKYDKALRNMTKSQKSAFTQLRNTKVILDKVSKSLATTTKALQKANAQLRKFKKTGGGLFGGLAGSVKNLLGAFGILAGVQLFARAIQDAFSLSRRLDSMAFSMKAVITDAKELGQTQIWLKQITKNFGAEIVTTTNRYIKFRAAAQQAGLTAKETQEIFGTFTKVAGVLGLRTDELQGIFLALEQMISKGKITTEELRRQLGERLPGAMDIMANSLKVTTAELDDMLKKGQVITKEVLPGFAREVVKAFGLSSVETVETLQAATTRLRNAWVNLIDDFNKGTGAATTLMNVLDGLADNLGNIIKLLFIAGTAWIIYKTASKLGLVQLAVLKTYNRQLAIQRALVWQTIAAHKAGAKAVTVFSLRMAALGKILRANALFLSVVIIIALIVAYKNWNKTIHETAKALNDLHREQIEALEATKRTLDRVRELSIAYKNLSKIINPSIEEQKELVEVATEIGKIYPGVIGATNRYGDAQTIVIKLLKDRISLEKQLLEAKALKAINEQFGSVQELTSEYDRLNKGLSITVKGVGAFIRTGEKSFEVFKASGRALGEWTEATNTQRIAILELIRSMQDNILTSEELTKRYAELAAPDFTTFEGFIKGFATDTEAWAKAMADFVEPVVPRLRKELNKLKGSLSDLLVNGYNPLNQILVDQKAILDKSIKDKQTEITAITGESFALKGKAKALRKIKDLTEELLKLESKKITLELEVKIQDENLSFEEREAAADELNKKLIQNSKDLRDQQLFNAIDVLEAESKGAGKDRIEDLTDEARQKTQKAVLEHNSRLIQIAKRHSKNIIDVKKSEIDLRNEIIENQFDTELEDLENEANNKINKSFERERKARDVFNESKKRISDMKTLNEVETGEEAFRNDIRKTLSDDQVDIQRRKAIALAEILLIVAKLKKKEAELDGADADRLDELQSKIDVIEASLQKLKNPIDADDVESVRDALIAELEALQDLIDATGEFASAIGDIFQSISDRKIENIEAEIIAEEEKFDRLIALNVNDELAQKNLRRNKELEIKKLEKERLKEEQKAAKIRQAFAIADIQIKLGQTIVAIQLAAVLRETLAPLTGLGAIYAAIQIPLAIATAAAQTAAVLAAPIPQFAKGGDVKINTLGLINDAGVQEYIERGTHIMTTTTKNAVIPLMAGDVIYKDYDDLSEKSMLMTGLYGGVAVEKTNFDLLFGGMENAIVKGFKGAKIINNIKLIGFDADHEAYRQSMAKWN